MNTILENNIGWCDDTGNKVTGCDKVSAGCKNCYAEKGTRARVLRSQGIETWGPKGQRYPVKDFSTKVRRLNKFCICDKCHRLHPIGFLTKDHFVLGASPVDLPKGKCQHCEGWLRRIRFFGDSNSDWLDRKWKIEIAELLGDIHDCPNIDFLMLTKRPENFIERLELVLFNESIPTIEGWLERWMRGTPPHNVWSIVSVENQPLADRRIPLGLQIPAAVHGLSVEPLLEAIDLSRWLNLERRSEQRGGLDAAWFDLGWHRAAEPKLYTREKIGWVIVGGESGKDRRDCGVEAIRDVARQCQVAGVPVYVKQDCAFKPGQQGRIPDDVWALKQFPNL